MKKVIFEFLKILSVFVILLNMYIFFQIYIKQENAEYSNINTVGYKNEIPIIDDKYIQNKEESNKITDNSIKEEILTNQNEIIDTFEGMLTAYGPDCSGCSGITSSGHDLRDGNIYYEDLSFGKLRIVAACKEYPFGTVVRISNVNIYEEPFLAIVLDRGGSIGGNKFDLAFETQSDPNVKNLGIQKNVTFEILRKGF